MRRICQNLLRFFQGRIEGGQLVALKISRSPGTLLGTEMTMARRKVLEIQGTEGNGFPHRMVTTGTGKWAKERPCLAFPIMYTGQEDSHFRFCF